MPDRRRRRTPPPPRQRHAGPNRTAPPQAPRPAAPAAPRAPRPPRPPVTAPPEQESNRRPTPPPSRPSTPTQAREQGPEKLQSPFGGFDRGWPPPVSWLQELITHSNFSFTGHYFSHSPLGDLLPEGVRELHGTAEERRATLARGGTAWDRLAKKHLEIGFGVVYFYLAWSVDLKPKFPVSLRMTSETTPEQLAVMKTNVRRHGQEQGRDIKFRVGRLFSSYGVDSRGGIVIVDNEDMNPLTEVEVEYYRAIFAEMRADGPGLDHPAVRPGFYAHRRQSAQLLEHEPDLFIWLCTPETAPDPLQENVRLPFRELPGRLELDVERFTLQRIRYGPANDRSYSWPIGRQTMFWETKVIERPPNSPPPQPGERTRIVRHMPEHANSITRDLRPVESFDMDVSFVRDPRFPLASPRISAGEVRLRAAFDLATKSMLMQHLGQNILAVPVDRGLFAEPEAPIVQCRGRNLFTVSSTGVILTTSPADGPPGRLAWRPFQPLPPRSAPGTDPLLRRARALCVVGQQQENLIQLFYPSDRHQLISRQRSTPAFSSDPPVWGDPTVMQPEVRLHPFSNIVATTRLASGNRSGAEETVVIFVGYDGNLCAAVPSAVPTQWGVVTVTPIDTIQALLQGTALAAVAPWPDNVVVFGVGRDRRLHVASHSTAEGSAWRPPLPVGGIEPNERLFAHSRLAAVALDADTISVAMLREINLPVIYTVQRRGGPAGWAVTRREEHPRVAVAPATTPGTDGARQRPTPAQAVDALIEASDGWDVNPFGDIVLENGDEGLVLFVAGTRPGKATVLMKRIGFGEPWLAWK